MAESLLLPPRRSRLALIVTAALGIAIAAGVILAGPWEDMGARAPYAILGGGAFAFGGVLGWLVKRPR